MSSSADHLHLRLFTSTKVQSYSMTFKSELVLIFLFFSTSRAQIVEETLPELEDDEYVDSV